MRRSIREGFHLIKEKLIFAPLVALPNFTKIFKIECYVSTISIRALLMQERKLIVYFSKKLNRITLNYPTYDKEL